MLINIMSCTKKFILNFTTSSLYRSKILLTHITRGLFRKSSEFVGELMTVFLLTFWNYQQHIEKV